MIVALGALVPRLGANVFVAENATVVGDVELADGASVWYGAVIRGDVAPIRIGARTNIQDLVCIHATGGVSETEIGEDVTVGHSAVLHGATIRARALIGMGAIVLDGAVIGEEALVAAGAVVPPGMVVSPRTLVRGAPAKVVRELSPEEARAGKHGADNYLDEVLRHRGARVVE